MHDYIHLLKKEREEFKRMQGTIDNHYFKSFPPTPHCNNLHSFWRHSLRHPLTDDFSGLESAREFEKPGER